METSPDRIVNSVVALLNQHFPGRNGDSVESDICADFSGAFPAFSVLGTAFDLVVKRLLSPEPWKDSGISRTAISFDGMFWDMPQGEVSRDHSSHWTLHTSEQGFTGWKSDIARDPVIFFTGSSDPERLHRSLGLGLSNERAGIHVETRLVWANDDFEHWGVFHRQAEGKVRSCALGSILIRSLSSKHCVR